MPQTHYTVRSYRIAILALLLTLPAQADEKFRIIPDLAFAPYATHLRLALYLPNSKGPLPWDGETVIRTLADRTRTFHFAGSQASADSSFSPHAKAQRRQDEVLGK